MANCKEGGKGIKVVKGNTSNLMSHLKTKHSKVYEEVRRKTDEKRKSKQSSSQSSALKTHVQQSLPGMAAKKPSWIAIVPFTRKSQEELLV